MGFTPRENTTLIESRIQGWDIDVTNCIYGHLEDQMENGLHVILGLPMVYTLE